MSLDGCAAGPDQSLDAPLGVRGEELHEWIFETRTGREMIGQEGGTTGVDDDFIARGFEGVGATIMGRNDLHLVIVPVLLGRGERLFENLDGGPVGYERVELVTGSSVVHVRLARTSA